MVRWHIQGYMLAGVAPTEIDECFHLWPGTTRAFADQFLDVLHCLHAHCYLANVVIRLHSNPLTEDDAERLILHYGLGLGRYAVDSLVGFFKDPEPIPKDIATIALERLPRILLHLKIRAAILAQCAPVTDPRSDQLSLLAQRLDFLHRNGIDLLDSPKIDVANNAKDDGASREVNECEIPELQAA